MADACEDPLMDLGALHKRQRRVLVIVLSINVATFVMVTVAAWFSRSTSLLSGGLDNFGDALTYALSLAVVGASLAAQARVALVKGILILSAAIVVAGQIVYRLLDPTVPVFETMSIVALANLGTNALCLWLLTPFRHGDINMASAWECSRNDLYEGTAVLAAAAGVYVFGSGWPDLLVAVGLLALFTRSAIRVLRNAFRGISEAREHGPAPGKVQDPVCRCWVDPTNAPAAASVEGTTYHFCDEGCRARFEADPAAYLRSAAATKP